MTEVLTVGALGSALLRRWRLITVIALLAGVAGGSYGVISPKTYSARAILLVTAGSSDASGAYQAAQFAQNRAATYPLLFTAPEVVDATRTELGLDYSAAALLSMAVVTNPTDSPLVEVEVTSQSRSEAREIADSLADNLSEYALGLERTGSRTSTISIQKAVPAREPTTPTSPSPAVLAALGVMAGAAVGVLLALLLRALPGGSLRRSRRVQDRPDPAAADQHVSAERLGALTDAGHAPPRSARASVAELDDDEEDEDDESARRRALAEAHASALLSLADDLEDDDEDDERSPRLGRGNRKKRAATRPATTIGRKAPPGSRDEPRSLSAGR